MDAYDNQLAHLIKLAKHPAMKEQSWHRAKELERCETGMWAGIANELKEHMMALNKAKKVVKS